MAAERNLEVPSLVALRKMSRDGRLVLANCLDSSGRTLVANAIYRAHAQGYFLLGSRVSDAPPGAGHLAHWELLRKLKAVGCHFYDLGLVSSCNERDGIYRFKRSLGGSFVSSGAEFEWESPILGIVRRVLSLLRPSSYATR
jgi:hypothetical protein